MVFRYKTINNIRCIEMKPFCFSVLETPIRPYKEIRLISKENVFVTNGIKKTSNVYYLTPNGVLEWLNARVYLPNKKEILEKLIQDGFLDKNAQIQSRTIATKFGDDLGSICIALGLELKREVNIERYRVDFVLNDVVAVEYNEKCHNDRNKEKEEERIRGLQQNFKRVIILDDKKPNLENICVILSVLKEINIL